MSANFEEDETCARALFEGRARALADVAREPGVPSLESVLLSEAKRSTIAPGSPMRRPPARGTSWTAFSLAAAAIVLLASVKMYKRDVVASPQIKPEPAVVLSAPLPSAPATSTRPTSSAIDDGDECTAESNDSCGSATPQSSAVCGGDPDR